MQGGELMFPFEEEEIEEELEEDTEEYYPREYEIDFSAGKLTGRIVEGAKALAMWAYLALQIERYRFYTYSWDYGSELKNLIGYTYSEEYVQTEVNRMVTECLTVNTYISGIENLEIKRENETLHISFTIITDYGKEEVETNV